MTILRGKRLALGMVMVLAGMPFASLSYGQQETPAPGAANGGVAPDSVTFSFERPGLAVPRFTMKVLEHEGGEYKAEVVGQPDQKFATAGVPEDRTFVLSATTSGQIFGMARDLHFFNVVCESKAKNVADTGKKTLAFAGPDGAGTCSYNYSENKKVQGLTEMFLAIAATLDEGRRLDHLHRYDRLGLDAELEFFSREVTAGRALEIANIAPSLRSIAEDAEVMQRVRSRANALLSLVPGNVPQMNAEGR